MKNGCIFFSRSRMVFLVEDQQCVYADYKQNSEMFIPFRYPE